MKTSFLKELSPDAYQFLGGLSSFVVFYTFFLTLIIVLSIFFPCGLIKFFIDLMMGWTLLSILFIGVVIICLDNEFQVDDKIYETKGHHNDKLYKISRVRGIVLCLLGIIVLYGSQQYKKYYDFQCQDFYLEKAAGVYHLLDDCEYIGINKDRGLVNNANAVVKIKGKKLLHTHYELCTACREWVEDAKADVSSYQFRRP